MRIGLEHIWVAAAILIAGSGGALAKVAAKGPGKAPPPLTLDNTRWKIYAAAARRSKDARARGFNAVLTFRSGMMYGPALEKLGFELTPYHFEKAKGLKNALQWTCEQVNAAGDKLLWQGTARCRPQGAWRMQGTLTRTSPDGRIYKFHLYGAGRPLPPPPPSEPQEERRAIGVNRKRMPS